VPCDDPDQVLYPDLVPGADVHGVRLVVPLRCEDDCPCGIVDVQELAGGAPGAPDLDDFLSLPDGVGELLDERRDDVRALGVEVVPGPVQVTGRR